MALLMDALMEVLSKPTMADLLPELAAFAAPICVALLVGILAGWVWRPRWVLEAGSAAKVGYFSRDVEVSPPPPPPPAAAAAAAVEREGLAVTAEDFEHLCQLVQVRDGGPEWQPMMEKSMSGYSYRAWKREPEKGPPEYRSSTIFDGAAPEVVRDFFWDDEFRIRNRWDDMLLQHDALEECEKTGTMVVRWVRKFPFFCSDREYVIGRRIWKVDGTYYCVTKTSVDCPFEVQISNFHVFTMSSELIGKSYLDILKTLYSLFRSPNLKKKSRMAITKCGSPRDYDILI